MIDGMKAQADLHASQTNGCWLALVPMTPEQKAYRDAAMKANADRAKTKPKRPKNRDKRSSDPTRHAA
jgi:hypothetical protein